MSHLWHTIRHENGTWQNYFGYVDGQETNAADTGAWTAISCAGGGSYIPLQLVGVSGGQLWHTIRYVDGTWQNFFGLVESQETNAAAPGDFTGISCAYLLDQGQLHVVGIAGGQLWHTIRNNAVEGYAWQNFFGLVESQETNAAAPGNFTAISCCEGPDDTLHVVGVANDLGQLWHTARSPKGIWQNSFDQVTSQLTWPGEFTAISCAGVGETLELVGVAGGYLWHTIRYADGTWQNNFDLIPGEENAQGNPGNPGIYGTISGPLSGAISCAAVGDQFELVAISGGELYHTIRDANGKWQNNVVMVETQETNNLTDFTATSCSGVDSDLHLVAVQGGPPEGP